MEEENNMLFFGEILNIIMDATPINLTLFGEFWKQCDINRLKE